MPGLLQRPPRVSISMKSLMRGSSKREARSERSLPCMWGLGPFGLYARMISQSHVMHAEWVSVNAGTCEAIDASARRWRKK